MAPVLPSVQEKFVDLKDRITQPWYEYLRQFATAASTVGAEELGFVIPEQFGAAGDGVTDDTVAVQAALDASDTVYFPNDYYITATLTKSGSDVTLSGLGNGSLRTSGNIIMLQIPCSLENNVNWRIQDMLFAGTSGANPTSQTAIKITGNSSEKFNFTEGHIRGLKFFNVTKGIVVEGSTAETTLHDWNLYSDLIFRNVVSPFFARGSGTGNVYCDWTVVLAGTGNGVCLQIGEVGSSAEVGDITISNMQFGGVGDGITLIGSSNYGERATITNVQSDAGIVNSVVLSSMSYVTFLGNCRGGAAEWNINSACRDITMPIYQTRPVTATTAQNDFDPAELPRAGTLRVTVPSTPAVITGLDGQFDGRRISFTTDTTRRYTLAHESTLSAANHRFHFPTGADMEVTALDRVNLFYCGRDSRWLKDGA
jgi:hypothetical protein